jgi:hypothetical protein
MNKWVRILWLLLFSISVSVANAQTKSKEINKQSQAWLSLNTTAKLTGKWGLLIDLHERRNNFLKDQSFHFVRLGINYWLKDNITFSTGYAHL